MSFINKIESKRFQNYNESGRIIKVGDFVFTINIIGTNGYNYKCIISKYNLEGDLLLEKELQDEAKMFACTNNTFFLWSNNFKLAKLDFDFNIVWSKDLSEILSVPYEIARVNEIISDENDNTYISITNDLYNAPNNSQISNDKILKLDSIGNFVATLNIDLELDRNGSGISINQNYLYFFAEKYILKFDLNFNLINKQELAISGYNNVSIINIYWTSNHRMIVNGRIFSDNSSYFGQFFCVDPKSDLASPISNCLISERLANDGYAFVIFPKNKNI